MVTVTKDVVKAAEHLCDMNVAQAVTCLRENGWIYEAAALVFLDEAVTGASDQNSECQNCGAIWPDQFLGEIEDLGERVAPGEEMPSGECPDPDCGAVCHPVEGRRPLIASSEGRGRPRSDAARPEGGK